jgi:hypothetical protein
MALDALARLQAGLLILSEADENKDKANDHWTREEARKRWSSARSLVLDTICEVRFQPAARLRTPAKISCPQETVAF